MSHSDSDSSSSSDSYDSMDKYNMIFDEMHIEDVIFETCALFNIRVVSTVGLSCCPYCDKDTEPDELGHICSTCGAHMTEKSVEDIWPDIESTAPHLYDEVHEFLVSLGPKLYKFTAGIKDEDRNKLGRIIVDVVSGMPDLEVRSNLTSTE